MCNNQFSQILHDLLLLIKVLYQNNGIVEQVYEHSTVCMGLCWCTSCVCKQLFYATIDIRLGCKMHSSIIYIIDILVIITTKNVCKYSAPPSHCLYMGTVLLMRNVPLSEPNYQDLFTNWSTMTKLSYSIF